MVQKVATDQTNLIQYARTHATRVSSYKVLQVALVVVMENGVKADLSA